MPLTLWRHLSNPMSRLISANHGVLYHIRIACADVIFARLILEFLSTTAALGVIYFVLWSTGLIMPVEDTGLALAGWLYTAWFYGALGLIICAVTERWEVAERFVQPCNYLALPLSGVFFMTSWLPDWAQTIVQYNPAVHPFEMFRGGFFGESAHAQFSVSYVTLWCVVLSVIGIVAIQGIPRTPE
jgi:capsular polysaccharide transport system permease protein